MTPTDPHRPQKPAGHHADEPLYAEPRLHDRYHAEHGHAAHDGAFNEDVAHEHSDVNVRALLVFCLGLVVIAAVIHVAMWGLFVVLERQAAANDPVMSPLARPAGQLPPEPRLLTNEPQYLERFRAQEAEGLKGIEDAKKRLLEQGLPVQADAPQDPWMGTRSPARGESSSGRMIPIRPGTLGPEQPVQPAAGQPVGDPKTPAGAPKSGGH